MNTFLDSQGLWRVTGFAADNVRVRSLTFGRVEQPRSVINRASLCFIVTRVRHCCCSKRLTIRVPADCAKLAATEALINDVRGAAFGDSASQIGI